MCLRLLPSAIALCLFCSTVSAQDADIQAIRNYYKNINTDIGKCGADPDFDPYCGYMLHELSFNRNAVSLPAVGTNDKTIRFWLDQGEEETVLAKVEVRSLVAGHSQYYEEFVYEAGALVFYFAFTKEEGITQGESRLYFKNGKCIKDLQEQKVPGEYIFDPVQPADILQQGGHYKKMIDGLY